MPVAPIQTVPYFGFGRGESGQAASWNVGWRLLRQQLIYAGSFQAVNMMRSLGDTLMPRSGLVEVTPTGLPNGTVVGFIWVAVPNKTGIAVINVGGFGQVWGFDLEATGTAAVHYGGVDIATPVNVRVAMTVDAGGVVYATNLGGKCYKIDPTPRTVTAIAGSPGGTSICIHGESLGSRLVVGNVSTSPTPNAGGIEGGNLVYASALNDFTNWFTAGQVGADPNFPANGITVGDNWSVTGLFSQRTHLTVAKQESWWVLTGGLNQFTARPVLRNTNRWTQSAWAAGMDGDDNIWFVPFGEDIPAVFDGAKMGETRTLHFNNFAYSQATLPPTFSVHRNMRHNEIFMAAVTTPGGAMNVALRQEDMWTFHTFTVPGGFAACLTAAGSGGRIHFCDGGAVGAGGRFYTWRSHLDVRVPVSGQNMELNTDAGGTIPASVTFPEWWMRGGQTIGVRAVIVDLRRWNTGFAAHNHYDLTVTGLRQYTDQAATPYAQPVPVTVSFDEAAGAVPGGVGASQTVRIQHNVAFEDGNGFQIAFSNITGLEIQKVQVVVQVTQSEPMAI